MLRAQSAPQGLQKASGVPPAGAADQVAQLERRSDDGDPTGEAADHGVGDAVRDQLLVRGELQMLQGDWVHVSLGTSQHALDHLLQLRRELDGRVKHHPPPELAHIRFQPLADLHHDAEGADAHRCCRRKLRSAVQRAARRREHASGVGEPAGAHRIESLDARMQDGAGVVCDQVHQLRHVGCNQMLLLASPGSCFRGQRYTGKHEKTS